MMCHVLASFSYPCSNAKKMTWEMRSHTLTTQARRASECLDSFFATVIPDTLGLAWHPIVYRILRIRGNPELFFEKHSKNKNSAQMERTAYRNHLKNPGIRKKERHFNRPSSLLQALFWIWDQSLKKRPQTNPLRSLIFWSDLKKKAPPWNANPF